MAKQLSDYQLSSKFLLIFFGKKTVDENRHKNKAATCAELMKSHCSEFIEA